MASGIDSAPLETPQTEFERGLQLISEANGSSESHGAAENMAETLTGSGDSTLPSAPAAEASGENGQRVLRARATSVQSGEEGSVFSKTPKFLARAFLRLKGFNPKLRLREFAREH